MNKILLNDQEVILNTKPLLHAMDDRLWLQLTEQERQEYHKLKNPYRQIEWSESRRAKLDINKIFGDLSTHSISHSWWKNIGITVVAGLANPASFNLGIDVEHSKREISDTLMSFVNNSFDDLFCFEKITLWTIKEAAFKSISIANKVELFDQYQIQHFNPKINYGIIQTYENQIFFKNIKEEEWIVTIALCESH